MAMSTSSLGAFTLMMIMSGRLIVSFDFLGLRRLDHVPHLMKEKQFGVWFGFAFPSAEGKKLSEALNPSPLMGRINENIYQNVYCRA